LLDRILQTATKLKSRAFFLFVGIVVEYVVTYAFDYGFYPFMIWKYGAMKGGVIMSLISLVFCYITLLLYDLTKKDWFGIELIKELREYEGKAKTFGIMSWMLRRGKFAAFLILSLKFDPFTAVVYMRKGANEFTGMDRKSWIIFFGSWAIGNLAWIVVTSAGISIIGLLWRVIH